VRGEEREKNRERNSERKRERKMESERKRDSERVREKKREGRVTFVWQFLEAHRSFCLQLSLYYVHFL